MVDVKAARGDSLQVLATRRLVEQADEMGLSDQVPERIREIVMGRVPTNGGAVMWARLNEGLPEADWPVGCCEPNDLFGPEYCLCWEPKYDLEQQPVTPVGSWKDCQPRDGMCGDCAYRPDSPERTDGDGYMEESLLDMARSRNRVFFCHENNRKPVLWKHPDGREVPGDPADYQPPFADGVPYQADGTPSLICAGWWAINSAFRRQVEARPSWLQDLADMFAAGDILPGGMVWVDEVPKADFRSRAMPPGSRAEHARRRAMLDKHPGTRQKIDEVEPTPMQIRQQIIAVLRRNPLRWARVFDGGQHSAGTVTDWYRKQHGGVRLEAVQRRSGLTYAVFCRYLPNDVIPARPGQVQR